jgi:hypothetical protein
MSKDPKHLTHTIHGTFPPEEWKKFFKEHFKKSAAGGEVEQSNEPLAKATASCQDYGCPGKHPISGTGLTGCTVEISGGRVVSVSCHYVAVKS